MLAVLTTAFVLWLGGSAYAGSATNITGLYFTGMNSGGGLQTQGTKDPNWTVSYASTNGGTNANTTYQGSAYVISSSYIPGDYIQNTTTAQWITAPGALTTAGGTANIGGDQLPGNGNTGANEGIYAYTLAFQIKGTGSGIATNQISISLTIAADDQYQVYVNPRGIKNGAARNPANTNPSNYTATQAGSATSAWTNTTSLTLANFGTSNNSVFVIGTNYLTVVVDNTNNLTGSSSSTAINPSGLYVYQVGSAMTIDGVPIPSIPEAGAWLPVVGALGLLGWCFWRRRADAGAALQAGF
jgi:hypothetical protein